MSNSEYKKHMKLKDCLVWSKRQNNITGKRSKRQKKADDDSEKNFIEECGQKSNRLDDLQRHHEDVDCTAGKGRYRLV